MGPGAGLQFVAWLGTKEKTLQKIKKNNLCVCFLGGLQDKTCWRRQGWLGRCSAQCVKAVTLAGCADACLLSQLWELT